MTHTSTHAPAVKKTAGEKLNSLARDNFGLNQDALTTAEKRSAISGYDLKYRIEAMVSGITAKKIKHVYQGDGAATAPGLMILPRIVATNLFPMRHVRILLGYTAHEISHQLKTNFKLLKALVEDENIPIKKRNHLKQFWNAIEDYRIEKLVKKEYPGFHFFIEDTRDFSAERFCERVDAGLFSEKDLANPYRIGAVGLTWIGAELNGYKTRAPREALNRLSPGLVCWIEQWRPDMEKVMTCRQALDLAYKIVEDLERLQEESDDSQNGDSGNNSSENNDSDETTSGKSNSNNEEEGCGDSEDEGSDQADEDAGNSDNNETEDSNTGKDESNEKADPASDENDDAVKGKPGKSSGKEGNNKSEENADAEADADADAEENIESIKVEKGDEEAEPEEADLEIEEIKKAMNSQDGVEAQIPEIHDESTLSKIHVHEGLTEVESVKKGQQAYSEIRKNVGSSAARSAGILRRLLQSTSKTRWNRGKEEGELDFGRLVGIVRGSSDVYQTKEVRSSVNTALSLLLDNSGSMTGHPTTICQETSVVLDMAVQGTKTNIEINGFTNDFANKVIFYRYRSFGQKGQAASASLGNMHEVYKGGTPVSVPLMETWRRLTQQKEPRRIIIVVSDGGADWNDVSAAKNAHDFIVRQGGIIIGIAIKCEAPMKQWCDNVYPINDISELPKALTELIRNALK